MKFQFTIRQAMILIVDVAALSAVATTFARMGGPLGRFALSVLFLVSPLSLAVLLQLLDRPGARRKALVDSLTLAQSATLLAWWLWLYNIFFDRTTHPKVFPVLIVMLITFVPLFIMSVIVGVRPVRDWTFRFLKQWSRRREEGMRSRDQGSDPSPPSTHTRSDRGPG